MATRVITWNTLLNQIDPDYAKESVETPVEYQFTARGLALEPTGDTREYEDGYRVFRGKTAARGPYAAQEPVSGGLTWGDSQLGWDVGDLVWGDE